MLKGLGAAMQFRVALALLGVGLVHYPVVAQNREDAERSLAEQLEVIDPGITQRVRAAQEAADKRKADRPASVVGLLGFGVAAGLLAVYTVRLARQRAQLVVSGHRTIGNVTRIHFNKGLQGAVIEFRVEGRAYQISVGTILWCRHVVGDEVPVRYLPASPSVAMPDTRYDLWLDVWIAGLLTATLGCVAILAAV